MFKEYDIVRTTQSIQCDGGSLEKGVEGTIVGVYELGEQTGYHTEFVREDGQTTALLILTEDQLEAVVPAVSRVTKLPKELRKSRKNENSVSQVHRKAAADAGAKVFPSDTKSTKKNC